MKKLKRLRLWQELHEKQLKWIAEHGADQAGYIANYHEKYGRTLENAVAIYNADMQELRRIEENLKDSQASATKH